MGNSSNGFVSSTALRESKEIHARPTAFLNYEYNINLIASKPLAKCALSMIFFTLPLGLPHPGPHGRPDPRERQEGGAGLQGHGHRRLGQGSRGHREGL